MRRLAIVTTVIALGLYICDAAFVIYATHSTGAVKALPTIPFIAALIAFRVSSIRWLAWIAVALNALTALMSGLALLWAMMGGNVAGIPSILLPLTAFLIGAPTTFNAIALARGQDAERAPFRPLVFFPRSVLGAKMAREPDSEPPRASGSADDLHNRDMKSRSDLAKAAFDAGDWSGFWRRCAAGLLDGVIVALLYFPVTLLIAFFLARFINVGPDDTHLVTDFVSIAYAVAYHSLFIASEHTATFGRAGVGIAVVDSRTGTPVGLARAMLRTVLSLLGYLLILPNLLVIVTKRKQSAADFIAKTVVVKYKVVPGRVVAAIVGAVYSIPVAGVLAAIAIPAYQDNTIRSRISEARTDLNSYARLVEQRWKLTTKFPASLESFEYLPVSKRTRYTIAENGMVTAELLGDDEPIGWIDLQPVQTSRTGELKWVCISDGFRKDLLPIDCPQRSGDEGTTRRK